MSTTVMAKQAKPYYGEKTKQKIVEDYFRDSVTMKELSELHGIFGSNTVADWIKKYGHLNSKKSVPIMNEDTQNEEAKTGLKKRQRNYEQHRISSLECDLDNAKQRVQFYSTALTMLNELALEICGIDLLKKTGDELFTRRTSQKS